MMDHYATGQLPPFKKRENKFYAPDPGLIAALDVALELNMPLLLMGEPGTGKTRFAQHVADRFKLGKALVFNAKTTSQASDLFYHYDALKHFHLVQNLKPERDLDLLKDGIIRFNALGEAIMAASGEDPHRSVVLIDEIDKAPRDFPNDLLNELDGDTFSFKVPELGREEPFSADASFKPIIIITSNSEKNLPEPFLRRCIFYHIPTPDSEGLLNIVLGKLEEHPELAGFDEDGLYGLINHFQAIRRRADEMNLKKPATAELISWLIVLHQMGITDRYTGDEEHWQASYSVLVKNTELLEELKDGLEEDDETMSES